MESNSTLQLEKMSPGEAVNSPPPSSFTSRPLKSSHAATFTSLPPELLQDIIETDFDHDSIGKRRADLARLCLVSKKLRLIAQPLLFRDFHLEIDTDYRSTTVAQLRSFQGGGRLADSIQILKSSSIPNPLSSVDVSYLSNISGFLSTLGHLQTVRTSSNTNRSRDFTTLLPEIASRQPSLKHLELPNVNLDGLSLLLIASSFPRLETLVVDLPSLDLTFYLILRPTFHLRRLVVTKLSDSTVLSRLLSSSLSSLRCLSISIDETMEAVVSIPELVNLYSLNIVMSKPDRASATGSDTATKRQLDAIFSSALGLPIKDVAISAKFSLASSFTSFILNSLPKSMESLTFGPSTHKDFDWLSLFPRQQPRPYPSLKKLSIPPFKGLFRLCGTNNHTELHFGVKDFYREYGVGLNWIYEEGARFDAWMLDAPQVINGYFDDDLKDRQKDSRAEDALYEEMMFEKYGW